MKLTICIALLISFTINCKSQSLSDLALLTTTGQLFDSAEIRLKHWGFDLASVKKETIEEVNYSVYYFKKETEYVILYRNTNNPVSGLFFIVRYLTSDKKLFDHYKTECLRNKFVKYKGEDISGNVFSKLYKISDKDYYFIMHNDNRWYELKIEYNSRNMYDK